MSQIENKTILNKVLLEIPYIKKVILSCETLEQYSIAINWAKKWKNSRMKLLIKIGFDKGLIEEIFNMKQIENFEYNLN